jgi:hypothetical protein
MRVSSSKDVHGEPFETADAFIDDAALPMELLPKFEIDITLEPLEFAPDA